MKAFDDLPKHLRDVHNYTPLNLSSEVTLDHWNRRHIDIMDTIAAMANEMCANQNICYPSKELFCNVTLESINHAKQPTRRNRRI